MSCNKRTFLTRSDAMKSKKRLSRQFDVQFSVYQCPCGAWHLTSMERDKRKFVRDRDIEG